MLNDLLKKQFTLPASMGRIGSLLPSYPGSILFSSVLNYVLKDRIAADAHAVIAGKRLRFSVVDTGLQFNCTWSRNGFMACNEMREPDVLIKATAQDFLLLALRKEDPDTLFFSRRLVMEGDTEAGVLLKNTLDALDLDIPALLKAAPIRTLTLLFQLPQRKKR